MYVYAPVEYHMLLKYMEELRNVDSNTTATSLQYIELLAIHSGNPALKTTTFRKAIIAYQKYGMNPPKKAHWTLRDAVNFAKFSNFIHKQMEECERELP